MDNDRPARITLKKILVPLDGSKLAEQILPYARLLGDVYRIPVELLSVDDAESTAPFGPSGATADYLKVIAGQFPATVEIKGTVELGRPAEVIVKRAQLEPGCLIAMVTHGVSGIKRWLLGSVATKVIQAAQNPLLLVRATGQAAAKSMVRFDSIIVPLDGSELAESVLPTVVDFATSMNTEVVLARAFQLPSTAYYRADDSVGGEAFIPSYEELVAAMSREAREYLDAKIKELRAQGLARVRAEILEGPAAEQIIDLARHTSGSLIAMCTHGRSGVRRWMLGSVTEKVVRHAENPILIIRAR
jgi:nucleotide-binding universal stress UspA family protein